MTDASVRRFGLLLIPFGIPFGFAWLSTKGAWLREKSTLAGLALAAVGAWLWLHFHGVTRGHFVITPVSVALIAVPGRRFVLLGALLRRAVWAPDVGFDDRFDRLVLGLMRDQARVHPQTVPAVIMKVETMNATEVEDIALGVLAAVKTSLPAPDAKALGDVVTAIKTKHVTDILTAVSSVIDAIQAARAEVPAGYVLAPAAPAGDTLN